MAGDGAPVIRGEDIAREAALWERVKFAHLGRTRAGVDCVGLGLCVTRECGVFPPEFDFLDYARTPNDKVLVRELRGAKLRRSGGPPVPGMVGVFQVGREPMHVAFFGFENTMVHADARAGKVVVHLVDERWRRRLVSLWTLPEVEY